MRRFHTFIITKRSIQKIAAALGTVAVCVGICIYSAHKPQEAVQTFSAEDDSIPIAILDEGVPKEDKPFDISGVVSNILGFDKDKPESIIESSSAIFDNDNTEDNEDNIGDNTDDSTETQSEASPEPTEDTSEINYELPSHAEIVNYSGLKINNATNYEVDPDSFCKEPLDIKLDNSGPEVLIMHTHTTECFIGDEMTGETERTTDESHNMCAVGDIIESTLNSYGIQTYHDKTIHDYPTYQGSYTRALETITSDIEKYPSIKVVLDIHRDAYIYNDGSKLRVAASINGSDAAQTMLVLGTDSMGLYHPYWKKNLALAAKIQSAAEIMYPGLMRPINLRRERFNMHVTTGSLLIEIGSNGNTLNEAVLSGEYIARALAAALLNG